MIPFFRKIRYRLAKNNQFLKYSRYAVGEIVLVVIGILIALQINTWNEERKLGIETDLYISRIINDLETDTTAINEGMTIRSESISNTKDYFEYFQSIDAPVETLIDSCMATNFSLFRYIPVDYTFRDMQTSGKLNLLNPEIQKLLLELSNKQKFALLSSEKMMDMYFSEMEQSNKYLGYRINQNDTDFYKNIGLVKNDDYYAQGLLHRHNMLKALSMYHMIEMNIEKDIILKSKTIIEALKSN